MSGPLSKQTIVAIPISFQCSLWKLSRCTPHVMYTQWSLWCACRLIIAVISSTFPPAIEIVQQQLGMLVVNHTIVSVSTWKKLKSQTQLTLQLIIILILDLLISNCSFSVYTVVHLFLQTRMSRMRKLACLSICIALPMGVQTRRCHRREEVQKIGNICASQLVANSYNPVTSSEVGSRRAQLCTRTVDLSGVRNFDRLVSCYRSQKRANGKGSTA